jgi:hypothetical protein
MMKKLTTIMVFALAFIAPSKAQNFLSKVPNNATMVVKYGGENFSKKMPLQKIDQYSFIKNTLFKMLHVDTLTSLKNMGINFEKDIYQYVSMQDSSINFVTMVELTNATQFVQLIKGTYGNKIKTTTKDGYEFLAATKDIYFGWNATSATIVFTTYQSNNSYYDYKYNSTSAAADTSAAVTEIGEITQAPVEDKIIFTPPAIVSDEVIQEEVKKPSVKGKNPVVKGKAKTNTTAKKNPATKRAPTKKIKESVEDAVISSEPYNYKRSYEDSVEDAKRDLWYQQQEMYASAKQKITAENITQQFFTTSSTASIQNDISYQKTVDAAANMSVWLNYENILKQYWKYFMGSASSVLHFNKTLISADTSEGFKTAANMYFDNDKMRIEQKTFTADATLAKLGVDMMNNKQSVAIANYVNPNALGHFSLSINTEAMANYYYSVLKKSLNSMPFINEYSDVVNAYVDLMEIIIDEKGIADLMPGNFLFVMHDAKTKAVSYTDYEYDKEYNRKEVTKTKNELSPNFTFVMETRKEKFFQKIIDLPIRFAKKERVDYQNKGGYYELSFGKDKYPINSLYFIVKDDRAVITTSKEVVDMTLANKGFETDLATKNSILNNNYSLKLNATQIIETMKSSFNTDVNVKIANYMQQNMGNITMESAVKDGNIQATTIMNIKGQHNNSLEFFFNMIDAINNIVEKDKQEKEKKID